jgi:hypothetical protein
MMRTNLNSRSLPVSLSLLAILSLAACAAQPSGSASDQTTTPAAAATASATGNVAILPGSEAPSATPGGSGGVQNLVITSAEKTELTALFVAALGIQVSDLPGDGPIQGDTYYAYDPATDTYWAMATFPLNGAASASVIAAFREHGDQGLYRKAGAAPWQIDTSSAEGDYCAVLHYFPSAVLTAWSLPTTLPPNQIACG